MCIMLGINSVVGFHTYHACHGYIVVGLYAHHDWHG